MSSNWDCGLALLQAPRVARESSMIVISRIGSSWCGGRDLHAAGRRLNVHDDWRECARETVTCRHVSGRAANALDDVAERLLGERLVEARPIVVGEELTRLRCECATG